MSIREYKEGEHKAGFIGLRVTVNVGGDYRQKYYNFKHVDTDEAKKKLHEEAKSINGIWNMERELIQSQRKIDSRERRRSSSAYTTGVSGIKMKYTFSKKNRLKHPKKYYSPRFLVSGSTDGKFYLKSFNIMRHGYDMAWFKAVSYYAEQKEISNYSHLLERKPPVEQFYIIYKYQCSQGHDIPIRRLPNELDPSVISS